MAKKDFSNANTKGVYAQIADSLAEPETISAPIPQEEQTRKMYKERKTYTEEEKQDALEAGSTQGRKGVKAKRINMAFPSEIYSYIRIMSRVRNMSLTDFVNDIIQKYLDKEDRENYEEAKKIINKFNDL